MSVWEKLGCQRRHSQIALLQQDMSTASQSIYEVFDHQKSDLFLHLLETVPSFNRVLVLVHTRDSLHELTSALGHVGIRADSVHGTKKPELRDRALRDFNDGKMRVLVTTDAVARSLDIPELKNVAHFDFPESIDAYLHYVKIASGEIITMVTPKDASLLGKVEGVMEAEIPRLKADGFTYASQPVYIKPGRKKGGKSKGVQSKPLQNKKPKFKNKRGR